MAYRIIIDRDLCGGFGACADLDRETFAMGDDGIAVVLAETTDRAEALEAARACPMAAIRVLDHAGAPVV
jgi:ferredoxin